MENNIINDTGVLASALGDAIAAGFTISITLGEPWGGFKNRDYCLESFNPSGSRYNYALQPAYYLASGKSCGFAEKRGKIAENIWCETFPQQINVFDIPRFSEEYGYRDLFLQDGMSGGYAPCRFAATFLQQHHNVSGILYQSYALYTGAQLGSCLAVIPLSGQSLPSNFFVVPSGYSATSSGIFLF